MDKSILGHTTAFWSAVGSMVNAVVVIALAFFNWRYLKAAKRQADAAESQANAATKTLAALQHAQALADAKEHKAMNEGIKQMLRFFDGLRESFQKYQRMGSFPPPHEWGTAVELLKIRHQASVADIETVTACLGEINRLYPEYNVIASAGGQQPRGIQERLIEQTSIATSALEKIRAALPA